MTALLAKIAGALTSHGIHLVVEDTTEDPPPTPKLWAPPTHRCGVWCEPYTGPVRLGRRGEETTPGRAT